MSHPVIVIELFENTFQALYSNAELSFLLVNRTAADGEVTLSGPHAPTLEKADLTKAVDGITIPQSILGQRGEAPFFTAEETPL